MVICIFGLESVKRAYDKGLFNNSDQEFVCPVSLEQVEVYLQILTPAYFLSLDFQRSDSSICETLLSNLN